MLARKRYVSACAYRPAQADSLRRRSIGEQPRRNLEQDLDKEEGPKDVDAARTLNGDRESEVDRKVREEVNKWKAEIATQLEREKNSSRR